MADTPTEAPVDAPSLYSVNRSQDGAEVRAQLSLDDAKRECSNLNASARIQVGMTEAVRDAGGMTIKPSVPIFASMYHGQICTYEVRSADGLVIA